MRLQAGCWSGVVWLTLSLSLATPVSLPGQDKSPATTKDDGGPPVYVLRQTVNNVVVDVIVTDAHGNPVLGLTQKDFSVGENGTPQKVLSFEVHDGSKPDFVPPKLPPLPADTFFDLP